MLANLNQEKCKDLDKCSIKMATNIKDNLEMIFLGVKVEFF
jgi:hypothetical protein